MGVIWKSSHCETQTIATYRQRCVPSPIKSRMATMALAVLRRLSCSAIRWKCLVSAWIVSRHRSLCCFTLDFCAFLVRSKSMEAGLRNGEARSST